MNLVPSLLLIIGGVIFMFICIFVLIAPEIAAHWLNISLTMTWWDAHNVKFLAVITGILAAIMLIPGVRPYG
jgi:hypothetical protein